VISQPEEHEKWGLVFLLALTLECWIEGLVTDAELRTWVFHALAAIACGAALYRRHTALVMTAGGAAVISFLSDLEALVSIEAPLELVLPSLLLLFGAGVLFFGFFQTPQRPLASRPTRPTISPRTREAAGKVVDAAGAIAGLHNIRQDFKESKDDPAWTPFLLIGGVLATLYSMVSAKWIRVDAFFGLTSRSLDFNDVRDIYESIGVKYFAQNFYFEWGFLLPYAAAALGVVSLLSWFTKRFGVTPPALYVVLALEGAALLVHTALTLGLTHAAEEPQVLAGPWIGSLGIAGIMVGTWLSESRR